MGGCRKTTWRCRRPYLLRTTTNLTLIILFIFINQIYSQPAEREPKYDPNHYQPSDNPCYDERNIPQRCVPDFINAAFNLEVQVTNTCGVRQPTRFCVQTGHMGIKKVCDLCDARVPELSHPASYLTDFNNPNNETWWQSETMLEGIQYPKQVNLTLRLGKAYDITYVRLKFVSPRPESFRIYKKTHEDDDWIAWQYYSGSCRSTYKLPDKAPILPGNEAVAQCTKEFSDISPLTGGNIALATLEGRPSAENFEESEVLQEWVTATEIRIVLDRMNTFGDEIFADPRVLRSYYWGISDFAVGGRCKCNGHASQCVKSTGGGEQQLVCDCKHHTTGVDCQKCEPFYVDRPWRAATSTEANECLPCNCNSLSNRCFFDKNLFETTGHGGHCIDCAGNTKGPHCEDCVVNHWRRPGDHFCVPCQCNEVGSIDGQCDAEGQCRCKPGVGGQFCDRCNNGFYDFSTSGCKDCHCSIEGSYNNTPNCSPVDGTCQCKLNIEGQRCDKCKPGYFHISSANEFGCTPCFCYGHSSVCSSADGYVARNISSSFFDGVEQWTGGSEVRPEDVQWAQLDRAVAISQLDDYPVYFYAPAKFLGDQRLAYNQDIHFTLRVQQNNAAPSKKDIVIVGASGHELSLPIFAQSNPHPSTNEHNYRFRIHANPQLQWNPTLREIDFLGILSNVTAIKIRGTYSKGDVAFISNFTIGSASLSTAHNDDSGDYSGVNEPAEWVETCKCSEGFVGQFCESCAHGYKRAFKFGGPLTKCIRCDCHNHSESCDAESGACICQHNTAGDTCERCARGYYGDALNGTSEDCHQCDCPDGGPCMMLNDGDTLCTECPEGYTGRKCDVCSDEFYGNPVEGIECKRCECNGNTDPNSIGNCKTISGECLKCIHHTTGFNCENCSPGYWGDALKEPKGDCKACDCYSAGTVKPSADYQKLECRQSDGQCECQPNVIGQKCDQCEAGFFNLTSGSGCQQCDCDPLGSINGTCDLVSGQCLCKPGVTGRKCNQCAPRHFGFSADGCRTCDCDMLGSETPDCDVGTGQCLCKNNVEGRRCDQCSENRYNIRAGCAACDDCYTLIQTRKNTINGTLTSLRESLDEIQNNPVTVNDSEFDDKVKIARGEVEQLYEKAKVKLNGDDSQMQLQVKNLNDQLKNARDSVRQTGDSLVQIDQKSARINNDLERFNIDKKTLQEELDTAIQYAEREGQIQLSKAQKAAERYGDKSQQLSEMAQDAKTLTDRQETHRKDIKKLAETAKNISKQALNEANEAIFGATSTSQQLASLSAQSKETRDLLNNTKDLNAEQNSEAEKVYDEAARVLSNADSIKLPSVLPQDLRNNAKETKEAAKEALKSVQDKVQEQQPLFREAQQALSEAQNEYRNVEAKQQEADRLLDEVEKYHNRAKEAFDLATKIWNDAKDSHDSLFDFQEKVERSKQEALQELNNLGTIKDELQDAMATTKEAEDALGDATQNADRSLRIAQEAKIKADNLAKESENLATETQKTRDDASTRQTQVDNLSGTIDGLRTSTTDFSNQALSDAEKSHEVLRKATLAESGAKKLHEQALEAEKNLQAALDQLNSLENVDDAQLAELEKLLQESEQRYENSESEQQLTERIRKAEQDAAHEKRQIDSLNKELENLKSIRDTLPTKCFNLVNLEQEGQK